MNLKLLTPSCVLIDQPVCKVLAEGTHGCFCLLPNHADMLAILVPCILTYTANDGLELYAAVDEGTLVKIGDEVLASTRQATSGADLNELYDVVTKQFSVLSDRELVAQEAVAKLEASFLRNYLRLTEEYR